MAVKIRNVGNITANVDADINQPKRTVLVKPNGGTIVVSYDRNNPSASGAYGDHTATKKFYIWESDTDGTFTLRATYTPGNPPNDRPNFTAGLLPNGNVLIAWVDSGNDTVRLVKAVAGTWTTTGETVRDYAGSGLAGFKIVSLDMSIADNGTALVAVLWTSTTSGSKLGWDLIGQRYGLTTWEPMNGAVPGLILNNDSATPSTYMAETGDISVTWIPGAIPSHSNANNRRYAVAIGWVQANGGDLGVNVYTNSTATDVVMSPKDSTNRSRGRYSTGAMTTTNITYNGPARKVWLYGTGNGEFTTVISTIKPKPWYYIIRHAYNEAQSLANDSGLDSNHAYDRILNYSEQVSGFTGLKPEEGYTTTYSNNVVGWYFHGQKEGGGSRDVVSWVSRIDPVAGTVVTGSSNHWNNAEDTSQTSSAMGGNNNNLDLGKHKVVYQRSPSSTATELMFQGVRELTAPIGMVPRKGSTVVTSEPVLESTAWAGVYYPQSKIKQEWQFATDVGFTTTVQTYTQDDDKFVQILGTTIGIVNGIVPASPNGVIITDVLPALLSLTQGLWYGRVRQIDEFGQVSPWYTAGDFTVSHPPTATDMSPREDSSLVYGAGNIQFVWQFSDSYAIGNMIIDYQTSWQISITEEDTGANVLDTGKTAGGANYTVLAVPGSALEKRLRWTLTLWDMDDVAGVPTSETFYLVTPPTLVIEDPGVVASPNPIFFYSGEVFGGRDINRVRLTVTQGSVIIYDTDWKTLAIPLTGVYSAAESMSQSLLENNQQYTVTIKVRDSANLQTTQSVAFTTQWTPPAAPSGQLVDVSSFNIEDEGYVSVQWDDTARDADFLNFNVYRQVNVIDSLGVVVETGDWELIGQQYLVYSNYEYKDYFSPSGHEVNYRVTQVVDRFGDQVESANVTPIVSNPASDGYWLIDPTPEDPNASAFKLSIVTDDQYTDEYEEAEFVVIGRGRKVERGERLGVRGTLTCQIRHTGGTTARQKKKRLEKIKEESRDAFLRTPFGDTYWVSVGNMSISRIAGVGLSEFCDVSIPYVEVSAP